MAKDLYCVALVACADSDAPETFVQASVCEDAAAAGAIAQFNIAHQRYITGEPVTVNSMQELRELVAGNPYWQLTVL